MSENKTKTSEIKIQVDLNENNLPRSNEMGG